MYLSSPRTLGSLPGLYFSPLLKHSLLVKPTPIVARLGMESSPSPTPHFRIGDRVQLISPLASIAAGAMGTVMSQFLGGFLYDVWFDGHPGAHVVDGKKLALALRGPSRRR
jgi:hypothetical protein